MYEYVFAPCDTPFFYSPPVTLAPTFSSSYMYKGRCYRGFLPEFPDSEAFCHSLKKLSEGKIPGKLFTYDTIQHIIWKKKGKIKNLKMKKKVRQKKKVEIL